MHKKLPKLDLNITNRCNFRCVHCAFDSGITKMQELSIKDLEQILRDTKELGGERIDLTGGEPTIREDLPEIIHLAKSLDYKIELVSNGSMLSHEKLVHFKHLGLDAIAISLDGASYETHAKIRKVSKETYSHVLSTIEDSVLLGFYTKVNTVAFSTNMNDLPTITEWCITNKINEHGIYYFTPVGRGGNEQEMVIEPSIWLNFVRSELMKYNKQIKLSIEFPFIEKNLVKSGLGCILKEDPYHLQILPNGDVYPCAILASYHKPIANVHDTSIKELWNNELLWQDYCQRISKEVFEHYNGSCVDLSAKSDYQFICPLRKFHGGVIK